MKNKRFRKKILMLAGNVLPLMAIGALSALVAMRLDRPVSMCLITLGLGLYLGFILQILIHELGHMAGGLLSGYKFCSFRIGSVIFVKQNGRINVRRFSLAGTGGQCLMSPPDMVDGRIPTTLYNLSGVIANALASAVCAGVFIVWPDSAIGAVFAIISLFGLYFAATNGIPMNTGMLDNDGKNAVSMRKSVEAQRSLWLQLKVNELTTEGVRMKDMPAEWFEVPSDEAMKNPLTAAVGVLCCARLMDEMKLAEADALMRRFLYMKTGINAIHRAALACDRIFIELIGENRPLVIKRMLSQQQLKIMKMLKTQPSVMRTEYAIKLLYDNDPEGAKKVLAAFDKAAVKYPSPQEMDAERELIALADEKHAELLTAEE